MCGCVCSNILIAGIVTRWAISETHSIHLLLSCSAAPQGPLLLVVIVPQPCMKAYLHVKVIAHAQHEFLLTWFKRRLAEERTPRTTKGISSGTAAAATSLRQLLVRRLGPGGSLSCDCIWDGAVESLEPHRVGRMDSDVCGIPPSSTLIHTESFLTQNQTGTRHRHTTRSEYRKMYGTQ